MAEMEHATRDWHTHAIIRVLETTVTHSHWEERTFHAGEELEMVQWGRAGRSVDRDAWWTSFDIDGAFIIEAEKVEVVRIIDGVSPEETQEPSMRLCPHCGQMHYIKAGEFYCPLDPQTT